MAKGEEYSKDSHDAESILAHYRIDKPFKQLLLAVATLGSSSNELSTTISCRLPFLSFSSFFLQFIKFGASENRKNRALLPFMPLRLQPFTRQLMDIRALLPSGSE